MSDITGVIHLVRHGNVENPGGVIYGRLPGFVLSERGKRQAAEAGERLADNNLGALWASPLERAQETALAIASHHDIEIVTDDRLVESDTRFEGTTRTPVSFLSSPRNWWLMRNPLRPTWGETFGDIAARMVAAITDAVADSKGGETAIVAHQTPVVLARKALAGQWGPPWLGTRCDTGSITTMVMEEGRLVSSSYFVPSS